MTASGSEHRLQSCSYMRIDADTAGAEVTFLANTPSCFGQLSKRKLARGTFTLSHAQVCFDITSLLM